MNRQVLSLPLKSLQSCKDKCDEKTNVRGAMRISEGQALKKTTDSIVNDNIQN